MEKVMEQLKKDQLKDVAKLVYLLNILDLFLTIKSRYCGGVEFNPIMQNVPFMIFCKVIMVGALCWWLGKRKEKIAHIGLNICAVYFAAIDVWHIWNLAACWVAFYFA